MKILNKLIESGEYGKQLFGDLFGGNEPDTNIEKDTLKSLANFFSKPISGLSKSERANITKYMTILFSNKTNFKELSHNVQSVYRYTSFNPDKDSFDFDFDMTYKSIKNGGEIYLGSCLYNNLSVVSSWTTKPYDSTLVKNFSNEDSILLKNNNMITSLMTDEFTNKVKNTLKLDLADEHEVVKVIEKPETNSVVFKNGGIMGYSFEYLEMFFEVFNDQYDSDLDFDEVVKFHSNNTISINFKPFIKIYESKK